MKRIKKPFKITAEIFRTSEAESSIKNIPGIFGIRWKKIYQNDQFNFFLTCYVRGRDRDVAVKIIAKFLNSRNSVTGEQPVIEITQVNEIGFKS